MTPSFTPLQNLLQAYRLWWLIVLLGLLGGLTGWLESTTQTPLYRSSIEFAVTIDTTRTGPLTERDQDRLQQSFGRVFFAPTIIDETLRLAAEQGIQMNRPTFRSITTQEWSGAVWEYSVHHPDPEIAFTLASLWGQVSTDEMESALFAARDAQVLQDYMDALIACGDALLDEERSDECVLPRYEDIEEEIAKLNARLEEAVRQSRNLTAAITFEQTRTAERPTEPVTSGQATMVFVGAVIGMLIGIWLVNFKRFRVIDYEA